MNVKLVREYAKTFAAFVAGVVGNAVVDLVNGSKPWPQTGAEWTQYAVTSFGAAIAVWATRNKITQKQLDADPNVVGGVVVTDLPGPTGTVIEGIVLSPPPAVITLDESPVEYKNPWQ